MNLTIEELEDDPNSVGGIWGEQWVEHFPIIVVVFVFRLIYSADVKWIMWQ